MFEISALYYFLITRHKQHTLLKKIDFSSKYGFYKIPSLQLIKLKFKMREEFYWLLILKSFSPNSCSFVDAFWMLKIVPLENAFFTDLIVFLKGGTPHSGQPSDKIDFRDLDPYCT